MPDERRQFRVLLRDSLERVVDLELLSTGGDVKDLMGQFAALLAAFSLIVVLGGVLPLAFGDMPEATRRAATAGVEEFLISTTMAVAGLLAVFSWNSVFPDRRDAAVLGPLPIRARTVFAAKVAAIAVSLGLAVIAVNVFTGLAFPFVAGGFRSLAAYWITMFAAALFVFAALLTVQGVAARLLSHAVFLRASSALQLAAFLALLGLCFMKPPMAALSAHESERLVHWLPSYWFLSLFQALNGSMDPAFGSLAKTALAALGGATITAAGSYALAYRNFIRKVSEQQDIAPSDRLRPGAGTAGLLAEKLLARPLDRAILLFTARTLARSRQHRMLLAAYGGIGLAIALAYAKDAVYGHPAVSWREPNAGLMAGSMVLLAFSILSVRAMFALPIELRANWIFRVTEVRRPAEYFSAVRDALLMLAVVPVCAVAVVAFLPAWPPGAALQHVTMMGLVGVVLVERSLHSFAKFPFACSYMPGKANLKLKFGLYGGLMLFAADAGVRAELAALADPPRFALLFAALLAAAAWAHRGRARFASSPNVRLQFDDQPEGVVLAIDLHKDGRLVASS